MCRAPAPAIWPERSASASAASSTNSPRAQLIRRAPRFICAMLCGIDHFFGAGAERGVQRDVIGAREKIGERQELDFEFFGDLLAHVGIVRENCHFECVRAARHFGADAAQTDQAERLAAHFGAHGARFFPSSGVDARH